MSQILDQGNDPPGAFFREAGQVDIGFVESHHRVTIFPKCRFVNCLAPYLFFATSNDEAAGVNLYPLPKDKGWCGVFA